ncbi:hypothetical protein PanWU01x14_222150 [Parasponia andersonii]|uniref:Uncharacterized protein n=1 Tax=Parasponia andersonii TaxID=3476 RepID=A0A2P5BPG8_PARAD|nr:hypothetical protein PanWU01x14_222150 [Parasponia andersonii]
MSVQTKPESAISINQLVDRVLSVKDETVVALMEATVVVGLLQVPALKDCSGMAYHQASGSQLLFNSLEKSG